MCFYQGFEMSELQCNLISRFYLQTCFFIQDITAYYYRKSIQCYFDLQIPKYEKLQKVLYVRISQETFKKPDGKRFIAARFKDKRLHQLSCIFLLFENKNKFMFWYEQKRFAQYDLKHIYVRFVQCQCCQNEYLSIAHTSHKHKKIGLEQCEILSKEMGIKIYYD